MVSPADYLYQQEELRLTLSYSLSCDDLYHSSSQARPTGESIVVLGVVPMALMGRQNLALVRALRIAHSWVDRWPLAPLFEVSLTLVYSLKMMIWVTVVGLLKGFALVDTG